MDIKKLATITTIMLFSLSCNAEDHAFKSAKEEILFHNITLSLCLGMAYERKSEYFTNQFSQATNGYREYSNISLDAYDELRSLIKKWLKKDYKSKGGDQNNFMKCTDLSNSDDVKELYSKFDPCKSSESWLDRDEYNMRCK